MDEHTRERLFEIGRRFYEHHAGSFDRTRRQPWPGWDRVVERMPPDSPWRVLDVGCGNGRFAEHLVRQRSNPDRIHYVGLDSSAPLLDAARQSLDGIGLGSLELRRGDALELSTDQGRKENGPAYDLVVLFGVLHHLPGHETRCRLLRSLAGRLAPGGVLAATIWRLDRSPQRFERLHIPWATWNESADDELRIDPGAVEAGDALLGWRGEISVPRYASFPTDAAIDEMEREVTGRPGLERVDRFLADGPGSHPPERGDNLYLVWRRRAV